jgi:ribosome-associated protein
MRLLNGPVGLPKSAADALRTVLLSLDDAKAEGTVAIDIAGKSALGDHMVVTSGRSHRHVGAIARPPGARLEGCRLRACRVEGLPHCDWVLIDAAT